MSLSDTESNNTTGSAKNHKSMKMPILLCCLRIFCKALVYPHRVTVWV